MQSANATSQLLQKLNRLISDMDTAMSSMEKLWLVQEIASTEERIKWALKPTNGSRGGQ